MTRGQRGSTFLEAGGALLPVRNRIVKEVVMCLAVPMRVSEVSSDGLARCQVGESETFVTTSVALLEEPPAPGDYVIVHAGFALRKLDPADAEETLKLLREILAAARPEDWG